MNSSKKRLFLAPGGVMTEANPSKIIFRTLENGATRKGKFQTIEQRRRQGYMRLARAVWIPLLNCHQTKPQSQ